MLGALLWGAALGVALLGGALESMGGCAPRLQWVPHSETFAQAQHQPYLSLCGGRVCSTYRTTYRVAERRVQRRVLRPGFACQRGELGPGGRGDPRGGWGSHGVAAPPAPPPEPLQAQLRELRERMEALEQALGGPLRQLDRVEALGEQLMDLEERLGACDCGDGKNGFGYKIRR